MHLEKIHHRHIATLSAYALFNAFVRQSALAGLASLGDAAPLVSRSLRRGLPLKKPHNPAAETSRGSHGSPSRPGMVISGRPPLRGNPTFD